ncbi:MAG: hypothetical protein Q9M16_09770 [Mariprofundus sp.]|nr:hypothetical protein [Mariprofundus sp.]
MVIAEMPALQETMDGFIRQLTSEPQADAQVLLHAEQCLEALAQYLIHFSDLFKDQDLSDEADYADWEQGLEEHMSKLLQGDVEPVGDLGALPLDKLDVEHLRDFLGWFVLRETSDSEVLHAYAKALSQWVEFIYQRGWWRQSEYLAFVETLADVGPAAERTARLSQVLYHFVRSGNGVPPRLRGQRFSRFVEGHGRVSKLEEGALVFNFENQGEEIGPVVLPQLVLDLIELGDVFDIELGLRGDSWVMVDVGPVYPRCVYVEVEEYEGLEKLS